MKKYLVNLIILALMLTTPLSCTGDSCPDFRPDCSRNKYIEEAIAVSVSQRRIAPRNTHPLGMQPVFLAAAELILKPTNINNLQQFILDSHLGRAPPQHHSVSA